MKLNSIFTAGVKVFRGKILDQKLSNNLKVITLNMKIKINPYKLKHKPN